MANLEVFVMQRKHGSNIFMHGKHGSFFIMQMIHGSNIFMHGKLGSFFYHAKDTWK